MNLPKVYDWGFGDVVELKHLETTFGISKRVALKYLKALRIKPLYFKNDIFFCLSTFNRIMFVLSRPGSPGFLFPASSGKANGKLKEDGFLVVVTDEILAAAKSPQVLAEMLAANGRDSSMVKKLLTHPPAEKEKK